MLSTSLRRIRAHRRLDCPVRSPIGTGVHVKLVCLHFWREADVRRLQGLEGSSSGHQCLIGGMRLTVMCSEDHIQMERYEGCDHSVWEAP
jgi:hypothetical protein